MFSKRPDGNLLKNLDPFSKIVPYIMYARNDATNMMFEEVDCRPMDEYIRAQAAAGVERTYMQVLIASMVRTMYQRPQLNRFVIGGKTYQRNSIVVSFVVHRRRRRSNCILRGTKPFPRLRTKSAPPLTKPYRRATRTPPTSSQKSSRPCRTASFGSS